MLTPAEKIKICATCRNRKRTIQKGIVCGLTEEKPQFEETCEPYVVDETEVRKEQRRAEYEKYGDTPGIEGADDPRTSKRIVSSVIYAVAFIIFLILGVLKFKTDPAPASAPMSYREQLECLIEKINKKNQENTDGSVHTTMSLSGYDIVYDNVLDNISLADFSEEDISYMRMLEKHLALYNLKMMKDNDIRLLELYDHMEGKQYQYLHRYYDASCNLLFSFTIKEDELKRAVSSSNYKCPVNDIKSIVDYMNKGLPVSDGTGIRQEKIVFNENRGELVYKFTLSLNQNEIKHISKEELKESIKDNWGDFDDPAMTLANINKYPIIFSFCAKNGSEYYRIKITPEEYRELSGINPSVKAYRLKLKE